MLNRPNYDGLIKPISKNLRSQLLNNSARINGLRTFAAKGLVEVFNAVPALLNVNEPSTVGYVDAPNVPYGIAEFYFKDFQALNIKFPFKDFISSPACIESLLLIGSSGTVGHTDGSDLDYWVCYDPDKVNGETGLQLLREKLTIISNWALEKYNAEANFYLIDLNKIFKFEVEKSWGEETEGEVAPHLLLEELYRTMVYVAGRIPLWWVTPADFSSKEYKELVKDLADIKGSQEANFINLGFPENPEPQEYLAAAMWLSRKSESDPFKGLLKIVPILEAVESDFKTPFLCELVKKDIFNGDEEEYPIDPYIMTIDRVNSYGKSHFSSRDLDLLRSAAVLKVLGIAGRESNNYPEIVSTKLELVEKWATKWGWPSDKLQWLMDYDNWPENVKLKHGDELLKMLISIYATIAHNLLAKYPDKVDPQDEDLIPFAARILSRRDGVEFTVEPLPSNLHQRDISKNMALLFADGTWTLHAGVDYTDLLTNNGDMVYDSQHAAKVCAWLVNNKITPSELVLYWNEANTGKNLTISSFISLMDKIEEFFPDVDFKSIDPEKVWSSTALGNVLLIVNFEWQSETSKLIELDYLYRTGWGEMRHVNLDLSTYDSEADKYLKIATFLKQSCSPAPENLHFYLPENFSGNKAMMNIKGALMAIMKNNLATSNNDFKSRIDN